MGEMVVKHGAGHETVSHTTAKALLDEEVFDMTCSSEGICGSVPVLSS